MYFTKITEEQKRCIDEALNLDEASLHSKVAQMKEWLSKQPHMPKIPADICDKLLVSFLMGTKMNTEKAKQKLESFYEVRHQFPEVVSNRDPTLHSIRDICIRSPMFPLPNLTPEGYRVFMLQHAEEVNGQKISSEGVIKCVNRAMSIVYTRMVKLDEYCSGEVLVIDEKYFYFSYLTEWNWPLIVKCLILGQEAYPVMLKAIFLINAPTYMQTVVKMFTPFLNEKIRKRIHVISEDHTELYKYVPKKILPADYGGDAPPSTELNQMCQEILESSRDLLMEDEKLMTDRSKRPPRSGDTFGLQGTFTKLDID